ncbi:hypothetical protein DPMN_094419 [Dreissena polymorpha]|uniref:Uncharacterized protein n=1 Tax=Dreissena polymorpha TaxID=45954 RepID=A0A9D4L4Q6_DREPO|nr:hypothetical protein DPMN_094419 [Dreissena polymorpha]
MSMKPRKNDPPPGSHFFNRPEPFKLIQYIIRTNVLIKFHADWTINVTLRVKMPCPPPLLPWRPYIIGKNQLTKVHDDWTIKVSSRKCFQPTRTIFQLIQDIIGTNLLTEFHENWTINVASRLFRRRILKTDCRQKVITKSHH